METLYLIGERIQIAIIIAWFIPTALMMISPKQRANCTAHFGGSGSPREPILLGFTIMMLKLILVLDFLLTKHTWPWFYIAVWLFAAYETKLWMKDYDTFHRQGIPHYELYWACLTLVVFYFT